MTSFLKNISSIFINLIYHKINQLNNSWHDGTEKPARTGSYEVIAYCDEPAIDNILGMGYKNLVADTDKYFVGENDESTGWEIYNKDNLWKLLAWREKPIVDLPDKYKDAKFYNDLWATKCPMSVD